MGCTSSQINVIKPWKALEIWKPSVWLISGGPSSGKGKICLELAKNYNCKYISVYDIVALQLQKNNENSQKIKQVIKEKKTIPVELIVKLIKHSIGEVGQRKLLIDGFPNTLSDAQQFAMFAASGEINFEGLLHVDVSEQRMIQCANKQQKSIQGINNVEEIIKSYLAENEKIKKYFQQQNQLFLINGEQGTEEAYKSAQLYFDKYQLNKKALRIVMIDFFGNCNRDEVINSLVQKYGFIVISAEKLSKGATEKNTKEKEFNTSKLQKQKKQIPFNIIVSQVKAQIQKYEFEGNFLLVDFPWKAKEAQQFNLAIQEKSCTLSYISFPIKVQNLAAYFERNHSHFKNKQVEQFIKEKEDLRNWYRKSTTILQLGCEQKLQQEKQIQQFLQKMKLLPRSKVSNTKLCFVSGLNGDGDTLMKVAEKNRVKVIDFNALVEEKIKQNGLYTNFIESFISKGEQIEGQISVKILLQKLLKQKDQKSVMVYGFPNSLQQKQRWEYEIGDSIELCGIFLYAENRKYREDLIRQKIEQKIISVGQKVALTKSQENWKELEENVKKFPNKHHVISLNEKIQNIEKVLKQFNFL